MNNHRLDRMFGTCGQLDNLQTLENQMNKKLQNKKYLILSTNQEETEGLGLPCLNIFGRRSGPAFEPFQYFWNHLTWFR